MLDGRRNKKSTGLRVSKTKVRVENDENKWLEVKVEPDLTIIDDNRFTQVLNSMDYSTRDEEITPQSTKQEENDLEIFKCEMDGAVTDTTDECYSVYAKVAVKHEPELTISDVNNSVTSDILLINDELSTNTPKIEIYTTKSKTKFKLLILPDCMTSNGSDIFNPTSPKLSQSFELDLLQNHTNVKEFECYLCTKPFSSEMLIKQHLNTHTQALARNICGFQFVAQQRLNSLRSNSFSSEKSYQCYLCKKYFQDGEDCRRHMTLKCFQYFVCRICDKKLRFRKNLKRHLLCHINKDKKLYMCNYPNCGKRFADKGYLNKHNRIHTGERSFACSHPNCEKKFLRKYDRDVHGRTHTSDKPYMCNYPNCGRKFSQKANLLIHNRYHENDRTHVCVEPNCGKKFFRNQLIKHNVIHTGERPHLCIYPQCGMRFDTKSHLNEHKGTHTSDKPYVCNYPNCGMKYRQKGNLNRHNISHTDEHKRFACNYSECHKKFTNKSNLIKHNRTHTGERPFHCIHPKCDKRFTDRNILISHNRTHTDERPFHCIHPKCGKKFKCPDGLASHNRTHTDDRPFACIHPKCGKKFKYSGDLCKHKRIHTNERQHACTFLKFGKRFYQSDHLTHISTHKDEKPFECFYP